jgi:hypothetical protein
MATEGKKYKSLSQFLTQSLDSFELERFLKFNGYGEVAEAVGRNVGGAEYFFVIIEALDRRGWINDAFFERLKQERPAKAERIDELKAVWLGENEALSSMSRQRKGLAEEPPSHPGREGPDPSEMTHDEDTTKPRAASRGGNHLRPLPPKSLDDEIRSVLRPLMSDRDSRWARLTRAFKEYPRLLDRINVDGKTGDFLDLLIYTLDQYGEVVEGKHAICVLMESVKAEVGLRDQHRIERIIQDYPC